MGWRGPGLGYMRWDFFWMCFLSFFLSFFNDSIKARELDVNSFSPRIIKDSPCQNSPSPHQGHILPPAFSVQVTPAPLARNSLSIPFTTAQHSTAHHIPLTAIAVKMSSGSYPRGKSYHESTGYGGGNQRHPLSLTAENLAYNSRFQNQRTSFEERYARPEKLRTEFGNLIETKRNDRNSKFSLEDRRDYMRRGG